MEKGLKTVRAFAVLIVVLSILITGCRSTKSPDLPEVLKKNPSLTEIEQAINSNSQRIQTLRSDDVTFGLNSISGWTKCRLAFARPAKMRMIATISMQGSVFDCGCNDKNFWFWYKYQNPPQLYWCYLDDITNSFYLNQNIPFDPTWFPDALGIVELQPNEVVEEPLAQMDGTLLIQVKKQRGQTLYTKHLYVEPVTAAIKKQEIYAPNGQKLLSVLCTEFQYNKEENVILPKKIVITSPQNKESLHLDLGTFAVNKNEGIGEKLFTMPTPSEIEGNPPLVNLKNNNINLPAAINTISNQQGTATVPAITGNAPATAAPVQVKPATTPTANTAPSINNTAPSINNTAPPVTTTAPGTGTTPITNATPVPINNSMPVTTGSGTSSGVTAHLRTQVTN